MVASIWDASVSTRHPPRVRRGSSTTDHSSSLRKPLFSAAHSVDKRKFSRAISASSGCKNTVIFFEPEGNEEIASLITATICPGWVLISRRMICLAVAMDKASNSSSTVSSTCSNGCARNCIICSKRLMICVTSSCPSRRP